MDGPKTNPKKFQFMVLGRSISDSHVLNIDGMEITSTDEVMLLGVSIDNKLTFKTISAPSIEKYTLQTKM